MFHWSLFALNVIASRGPLDLNPVANLSKSDLLVISEYIVLDQAC